MYVTKQVRILGATEIGHVSIKKTRGSTFMDVAAGIIEPYIKYYGGQAGLVPSAGSLISKVFSP